MGQPNPWTTLYRQGSATNHRTPVSRYEQLLVAAGALQMLPMSDVARAYSKRVPRTNCALRIKKVCTPDFQWHLFLSTS